MVFARIHVLDLLVVLDMYTIRSNGVNEAARANSLLPVRSACAVAAFSCTYRLHPCAHTDKCIAQHDDKYLKHVLLQLLGQEGSLSRLHMCLHVCFIYACMEVYTAERSNANRKRIGMTG